MFDHEHHRAIAVVLESLNADLLRDRQCYFGGGTAMVMRFGEWRVSSDIDFVMSDWAAYRDLRQLITADGISAVGDVTPLREVRADRYGIRTLIESPVGAIKLEIIHEGRISLTQPESFDRVCGVTTLGTVDMIATKLLANDDRWADRSLFSRDLIDLALIPGSDDAWTTGRAKAVGAYGGSVNRTLDSAVNSAIQDPSWLATCVKNMQMTTVAPDELRGRIAALTEL